MSTPGCPTERKAKGHPIFAALYDRMSQGAERRLLGPIRRELLRDLQGEVLEIGAGTGANLPHYSPGVRVVAAEPDPFMLRRGRERPSSLPVEWVQASAESLPFPDGRFDAAVATLVLCSVNDPVQALTELRRVLRPGGRLRFLEHVASETPGWRRFQKALTPLWKRLAAGCHLDRDTLAFMAEAGFRLAYVNAERPVPFQPIVYGEAVRRE